MTGEPPGGRRPAAEAAGPHAVVNPPELAAPRGFSHAVVATGGRTIYLGGQTAHDRAGRLAGATLVQQMDAALANLVLVLTAAGAEPGHLVSVVVYTTDAAAYRASPRELGTAWRRHLGRHYPAMAWFEVAGLYDPAALVELVAVAVVPGD